MPKSLTETVLSKLTAVQPPERAFKVFALWLLNSKKVLEGFMGKRQATSVGYNIFNKREGEYSDHVEQKRRK